MSVISTRSSMVWMLKNNWKNVIKSTGEFIKMALTSVRNQSTVVDEETDEDRGQTLRSLHSFSPQRLSVFLVDVFVLLTTETPAMSGDISVFFLPGCAA